MSKDDEIDALAEKCLAVYASALRSGTPDMIALARLLLFQLASQIRTIPVVGNGRADNA